MNNDVGSTDVLLTLQDGQVACPECGTVATPKPHPDHYEKHGTATHVCCGIVFVTNSVGLVGQAAAIHPDQ